MERCINATSNPKAIDAKRTGMKWLAYTKTHLKSKVVKEKTKKPIIALVLERKTVRIQNPLSKDVQVRILSGAVIQQHQPLRGG